MEEIRNTIYDPFTSSFTAMKMRYKDYDDSLTEIGYLNPGDSINVFIDLETVLKNLSTIQDLEKKIVLQRDFPIRMISSILNLAAHYKKFFVSNTLRDTKIYLYHTDLNSDEFHEFKYNEDYRSYYLNKFNSNPKYATMTEMFKEKIFPDTKTYCEFIPNVYYISAHNIEGSLVPYIIAKHTPGRKNLLITGEFYETQYCIMNNFVNHFIHRNTNGGIYHTVNECLKSLTKKENEELDGMVRTYNHYNTYCSLISSLGDRSRSVDGLIGIGPKTLKRLLDENIAKGEIRQDSSNPELISKIFTDDEMRKEFINNYYCTNLEYMFDELTEADKSSIYNQIVDRSDINGIKQANSSVFINHPLILEGLLA